MSLKRNRTLFLTIIHLFPNIQEDWENPTNFTYKIDAIAKKLNWDMDKNNTDIKPSTPLNIGKLPVLLKVEKPQLDMSKIPGVPIWSPEDENDGKDNKQGVSTR